MQPPRIVSREEWIVARREHLANEKALTRALDELRAERRRLPWVRIDKEYVFDGAEGRIGLAELFAGRSRLFVQHFMFSPDRDEGCIGCSFHADHVDAAWRHLAQRDMAFAAISRAPFAKLDAYRRRMGWRFRWVSSSGSDFNRDFGVSFTPAQIAAGDAIYNYAPARHVMEEEHGVSVFVRREDGIFHTYSAYARGVEPLVGAYAWLDMMPDGRDEAPAGNLTAWVRRHDSYGTQPARAECCCDTPRQAAE